MRRPGRGRDSLQIRYRSIEDSGEEDDLRSCAVSLWEDAINIYGKSGSTTMSLLKTYVAKLEAMIPLPEFQSDREAHEVLNDEGSQSGKHESCSKSDCKFSRMTADSYDSSKAPLKKRRLRY